MTSRQKRIVAILAMANIVVMLALIGLVTRGSGTGPSPRPSYQTPTPLQEACQRQAVQLLADAGLGGTVTLAPQGTDSVPSTPEWSLRFHIAYPLAPGEMVNADTGDAPADVERASVDVDHASVDVEHSSADVERSSEAAQSVWTAFDVALALQEQDAQCAIFSQVDVTVLVQDSQTGTRISASARTADLVAFHAGELSEDDFIDRVTYVTSAVGGE